MALLRYKSQIAVRGNMEGKEERLGLVVPLFWFQHTHCGSNLQQHRGKVPSELSWRVWLEHNCYEIANALIKAG